MSTLFFRFFENLCLNSIRNIKYKLNVESLLFSLIVRLNILLRTQNLKLYQIFKLESATKINLCIPEKSDRECTHIFKFFAERSIIYMRN